MLAWDVRTGVLVESLAPGKDPAEGWAGAATGRTLAAVTGDDELARRVRRALTAPGLESGEFAVSDDGTRLFVSTSSTLSIVNLQAPASTPRTLPRRAGAWAVSLDGSRLVVQGDDPDTLELHDGEDGRHLETLVVFDERDRRAGLDAAATSISMFGGVALSRDGGTLVVASLAKTVAIDVDTRKRVFETEGCDAPVAVSPDGRWLSCGRRDTLLADLRRRRLVATVRESDRANDIHARAFSDDGTMLATAGDVVVLWDVETLAHRRR